ncbi:MAG: hypothetical protein FWJ93_14160 [Micromonosporaceae bacterium]
MTQRKSSGSPSGGQESMMQNVREQTSDIGHGLMQAGGRVAHAAVDEGKEVASRTGHQARTVLDEAFSRIRAEAGAQQKRIAERLHTLGNELQEMSNCAGHQDMATGLVHQASGTLHQVADWLGQREPGMVMHEVRDYARRHPGMFLAGAAIAGMLAGRLTKNLAPTDGMARHDGQATQQPAQPPPAAGTTPPPTQIEPAQPSPMTGGQSVHAPG